MNDFLPKEVQEGLKAARRASIKRNDKLCVHDGDDVYRIKRIWDDGLSLGAEHGDKLRGRVEIYDGARHLYQCLIVNSRREGDEYIFDFKWLNPVTNRPAADFVRPDAIPAGLITKASA
ncbi:hypothetical protein [Cognatiyoonia sp.]|uniref:hypothetical protein n=1 Tax=Cognatiyoonia sp. TaxID=2211652 RepID=UPI003F6A23E5